MASKRTYYMGLLSLLTLLAPLIASCGGSGQPAPGADTTTSGQAQPTQVVIPTAAPEATEPAVGGSPTQSLTVVVATQPAGGAAAGAATINASPTGLEGGNEAGSIELSAEDVAFDKNTITVRAGSTVVIEFTNNDSVPHNFAAYTTEAAEEKIFVGEIITGPDKTVTYEFEAPSEPGTYFFRCDVHPNMTGELVVQ